MHKAALQRGALHLAAAGHPWTDSFMRGTNSGETVAAELRRVQGQKTNFEIFGGKSRASRAREKKSQHLAAHRQGKRQKRKPCDVKYCCSVCIGCIFIALMLFGYYQLVQMVEDERAQLQAEEG